MDKRRNGKMTFEKLNKLGEKNKGKLRGKHNSPKTEFKKGQLPWNKGKKDKRIKMNCTYCEKEFEYYPSNSPKREFCSASCKTSVFNKRYIRRGERHWNWKGGLKRSLGTIEYRKWRMAIFLRDNFTCQDCGKRGCYLEAHHIKRWKDYPELRFDINNGVTLCYECHQFTKGGTKWKIIPE